jgi:hypothetical protein
MGAVSKSYQVELMLEFMSQVVPQVRVQSQVWDRSSGDEVWMSACEFIIIRDTRLAVVYMLNRSTTRVILQPTVF